MASLIYRFTDLPLTSASARASACGATATGQAYISYDACGGFDITLHGAELAITDPDGEPVPLSPSLFRACCAALQAAESDLADAIRAHAEAEAEAEADTAADYWFDLRRNA